MTTTIPPTAKTLAYDHNIRPRRCGHCGLTERTGVSWQGPGYDDGRDPDYTGFQCCNCGGVEGLTRGHILRRIRWQSSIEALKDES